MSSFRSVSVFSSILLLSAVMATSGYADNATQPNKNLPASEPTPVILDGTAPTQPPPVILDGVTPTEPAPTEPAPIILDGTTPTEPAPTEPAPVILDGAAPTEPTTPPVIMDGITSPPPVIIDGTATLPAPVTYELPEFTAGETATITAQTHGESGFLQGWIDWNDDGDYDDNGEHIIINAQDNVDNALGNTPDINTDNHTIAVNIPVPSDATLNETQLRLYWSTLPNASSTADATTGQVDEYPITVLAGDSGNLGITAPRNAMGYLEYSIRWDSNAERYRVYMRPRETPAPDQSMTAQITLKVPHATGADQFQVSALTSTITNTSWSDDSRANAPTEDESADYLSFSLNINNASAFNWQANQEIEVFNFVNSGTCIGPVSVLNNDTDPFIVPVNDGGTNSINSNPGNQFSNLGWNIEDIAGNDYAGNYGNPADCSGTLDSDNDGLSNLNEESIGSNPNNPDSDQDGISDGIEAGNDTQNPRDSDGDGTIDILDSDDDNDGLLTRYENYNAGTPGDDDTDNDGTADYLDNDDDGDGKLTQNELADPNGDGNPADANDQNNDGIPDYLDDKAEDKIVLQVKGILQGAYNGNTQLMRDDLNQQGLLPMIQPFEDSDSFDYLGIETINLDLLTRQGDDAPVDWVLVELLDANDRETRIATKAAILQRDGDIMDALTGSTDLEFSEIPPGDYFVGLNHRNHLGVVSLNPISLAMTPKLLDFTQASEPVYGDNARFIVNELAMLWAGEADNNNSIISSGPGNDVTALLGKVLTAKSNALFNSNFRMLGYSNADFNLDGATLFAGPDNDTNVVMGNVLLHPENSTFSANYVVRGRKPKHKWPANNKDKR